MTSRLLNPESKGQFGFGYIKLNYLLTDFAYEQGQITFYTNGSLQRLRNF